MQRFLRLLRTRVARYAVRRRRRARALAARPVAAPNTTVLSYDSFR
jgi:hypothetical protein